jgi:hypothetical protein
VPEIHPVERLHGITTRTQSAKASKNLRQIPLEPGFEAETAVQEDCVVSIR